MYSYELSLANNFNCGWWSATGAMNGITGGH